MRRFPNLIVQVRKIVSTNIGSFANSLDADLRHLPRVPKIALLVLLPAMSSGIFRAVGDLSIFVGFVAGLLLLLGLFAWRMRYRVPRPSPSAAIAVLAREVMVELTVILPAAGAVFCLVNRDFAGFMNIDGWDSGSHLYLQRIFVQQDSRIYNGFVAQYALSHWLETLLGFDRFRAVAICFYSAVAIALMAPMAISVALVRRQENRHFFQVLLALVATAAVLWLLADAAFLPAFHYLQGMGYYPQIFCLVPVAFIWLVDASLKRAGHRIIGYGVGLAFLRYTYGLNLPDTTAALGMLLLLDATNCKLAGPGGVALVALAAIGYTALVPIFEIWGGIARHNVNLLLAANLLVGVLLFLAAQLMETPSQDAKSCSRRSSLVQALRFPFALLAANAVSFSYFQATAKQPYYLNKYQAITIWSLVAACSVVVGFAAIRLFTLMGSLLSRQKQRLATWTTFTTALFVAISAIVAGSVGWRKALAVYRPAYVERVKSSGPPYLFLRPLVDRRGMSKIRQILREENKAFGGYLTGNFPMFSFMNGVFDHHSGSQAFFPPKMEPGHCVFWVRPEHDIYPNGEQTEINTWRTSLSQDAGVPCERYNVRWKLSEHSLCHKCF